ISIIIICFDGAPKVTPEALQQEAELEHIIEDQEPDLLYVMKFLASEDIPGLPPMFLIKDFKELKFLAKMY
uniref:Protein serine/threonine phosphatase 2C C-terminal domain-containing protein n=1 Tax=Sinocyclocheilus grahami TaxID=75366 RepID=A0A672QX95_SINGR